MMDENVLSIKDQQDQKTFGSQNTFVQTIHHFRKNMGEFEGMVFGYLSLDLIVANQKISRPMLFISDVGDNTSQRDNSHNAVMTRGIEITFATPLEYQDDYFNINVAQRGENLQNHFLEFKYRILQVFHSFKPSRHNRAVVSITNLKYVGSRFIGITEGVAYYSYNFTYNEKLNMKLFNVEESSVNEICWSHCIPCEPEPITKEVDDHEN